MHFGHQTTGQIVVDHDSGGHENTVNPSFLRTLYALSIGLVALSGSLASSFEAKNTNATYDNSWSYSPGNNMNGASISGASSPGINQNNTFIGTGSGSCNSKIRNS